MAVEDKYVDSKLAAGKLGFGPLVNPSEQKVIPVIFEIAAADDNGSKYRLLKNINPDLIPVGIEVFCDAITGGNDFDIGIYDPIEEGGAVINANVFADALDLSSAKALTAAGLFGMKDVNIDSLQKRIFEHAGHTLATRKRGYDIVLTGNTVGSGAGTVLVLLKFIQG